MKTHIFISKYFLIICDILNIVKVSNESYDSNYFIFIEG